MDYCDSQFIQSWRCKTEFELVRGVVPAYNHNNETNYNTNLKGEVMQNLAILAILFRYTPSFAIRELSEGKLTRKGYKCEHRIDLAETLRNQVKRAWEIKKTLTLQAVETEQILHFQELYSDKLQIVAGMTAYQVDNLLLLLNIVKESELNPKIENFFLEAYECLFSYHTNLPQLHNILALSEFVIDQTIQFKNPGEYAYQMLNNLDLNIEAPFEYVSRPRYNANLLTHDLNSRIIQTAVRPHLLEDNLNSRLEIRIHSKSKGYHQQVIYVCFSTPFHKFENPELISRNRTFVDEEIGNFLDPILAHRSNNLNFWNFLEALNLSFCELAKTQVLVVEIE